MPAFLRRVKETPRYTLYEAETGGYAAFAAVTGSKRIGSPSSLLFENRSWLLSADPAAGRFIRYAYPAGNGRAAEQGSVALAESPGRPGCPGGGTISQDRVLPGRIDLQVECQERSTLVLKTTYHPNWHVTIDGREERSYMVSPSYIGLDVPSGPHQIRADYRSPAYKTALLLLGACTLLATIWFRRRLARLDAILSQRP